MTRETFAAQRRGILVRGDRSIEPAVDEALANWGAEQWWTPITTAAGAYFDEVAVTEGATAAQVAGARDDFLESLGSRLRETTEPAQDSTAQAVRLTQWVSTASVNSATAAATVVDDAPATLEWVSMHDDAVRSVHRTVDGQTVPAGGTFSVAGYDLHYPGEPVGPPDIWINCRCVVRPGPGGDMTAALIGEAGPERIAPRQALTAAAPSEPEVDPEAPEITDDDLDLEVPFYGVAAPEGVPTGDRRKFDIGAIRNRDLPLTFRHQPRDVEGHGEAVPVGRIDRIWRDEESNLIKYEGVFHHNEAAETYIDLLANRIERGVSVDLDDTTVQMQNEDGSAFDSETWQMGDPEPYAVVVDGRIASLTGVMIPAFQEAFVAIGTWADHEAEPAAAPEPCEDCEVAALVAQVPAEHREFFSDENYEAFGTSGVTYTTPDGHIYMFDDEGMHAFTPGTGSTYAPGTHDGPGWITHPRATARIRNYWVHGRGAAKIRWGQPGDFNRCRAQLSKYVKNPKWLAGLCANMHKEAIKVWPGREVGGKHALEGEASPAFTLVASAAAQTLPYEWFTDPKFEGPTPITIDEDGRIYGHLAEWSTCHLASERSGLNNVCTSAPFSATDYAYFTTGAVLTERGQVAVGNITMGTGHAAMRLRARPAAEHYDNTGTVVADVAAGEDAHGIWVAGAIRDLDEKQVRALRASALSGDWRQVGTSLELVGALAVNVPGFPIPRVTVAAVGDQQISLVASGVVHPRQVGDVDAYAIADRVTEILAERVQRAAAAAVLRADARATARRALHQ